MHELLPRAARAVALLTARKQTIAVAESSAGGLITAALLAVPGASACVRGGIVVYTYEMRRTILGISDADMRGITPSTEAYALLKARRTREYLATDWALTETARWLDCRARHTSCARMRSAWGLDGETHRQHAAPLVDQSVGPSVGRDRCASRRLRTA